MAVEEVGFSLYLNLFAWEGLAKNTLHVPRRALIAVTPLSSQSPMLYFT